MADTSKTLTKLLPFRVNPDDPFEGDALDRRELCEGLANFIENSTTPYTLAISADWGSGKTVFLQMLEAYLKKQEFRCVFFNAWEADFYDSALPALIGEVKGEIERQIKTSDYSTEKAKDLVNAFRSWETASKIVVALCKELPVGGEIIGALSQTAKEAWKNHDSVEHYLEYQKALKKFKKTLGEFASNSENGKPLVILVDELDRCRPNFALDVLEKTKHIFDVKSVFFVFGLNKKELGKTIETIYGQIDAERYLRRFFDETMNLVNLTDSLGQAMDRIGLTDLLEKRDDPRIQGSNLQFTDCLNLFFGMFGPFSLRDREQILAAIKITLSMTPLQERAYPVLLFYFTIVKLINPDLFQKSKIGANPKDQSSFPFKEHLEFYRNRAGFKDYQDIYAGTHGDHLEPYVLLNAIHFQHNDKYKEQVIQKINECSGNENFFMGSILRTANEANAIPSNIGSFVDKVDSLGKLIT